MECTNFKVFDEKMTEIEKDLKNSVNNFTISMKNFVDGPLIISDPGIYTINEDITLDFNAQNDYRVNETLSEQPPFVLDHFSGIIIKSTHVILDLNGHTIKMSEKFALQQRFFAIIELASSPFLPGQGPADFGPIIESSRWTMIRNGNIGRSSHHGIKGNKSSFVILKNLNIQDFEVAGIALNGGKCFKTQKVQIGPNCQNLPVLGTYSAARFLPKFYAKLKTIATLDEWNAAKPKFDALNNALNQVVAEVLKNGETSIGVFRNEKRVPDGNNYGVLFHPPGLAVHDYINRDISQTCDNVYLSDVSVKDIKVNVREVVGLSANKDGTGIQLDPSGSVFPITTLVDFDGTYKGNVLSDAQIAAAEIANRHGAQIGKLSIKPEVVEWAKGNTSIVDVLNLGYTYKCGGDIMFHLAKPLHGFRFDGIMNLKIKRCSVTDLVNIGRMGDDQSCGSYKKSHDQQIRFGYHGSDAIGFGFSGVTDAVIRESSIYRLHSDNGSAIGFRFINGCRKIKLLRTNGDFINCGEFSDGHWFGVNHLGDSASFSADFPNGMPSAVGIKVEDENCDVKIETAKITNLDGPGSNVPIWSLSV